jgi:hypothetical protein
VSVRKGIHRPATACALLVVLAAAPLRAEEDVPTLPIPDPCPDGKGVLAAQTPADQALQNRVEGALATAGLERMTKVEVAAIGSTVCLRGTAASTTDRKRAEVAAAEVDGVANVVNRLAIPLAE